MSYKKMKKEELELLSNKDITNLILEESNKPAATADLFKKIIKLLELPENTFEQKIGDYYTALSTDKRFILLDNGKWDLRSHHTSDKIIKITDDDDDEDGELSELDSKEDDDEEEDNFDDTDDTDYDDSNEDLKDLVVIDEDELENEE